MKVAGVNTPPALEVYTARPELPGLPSEINLHTENRLEKKSRVENSKKSCIHYLFQQTNHKLLFQNAAFLIQGGRVFCLFVFCF